MRRSIGEIVSALIVLSLTISSVTLAYTVAGHVLSTNGSLFKKEAEDLRKSMSKPWIHVVRLGDDYYMVVNNPYDKPIILDSIVVNQTVIASNVIVKPHSSLIYRLDGRPSRVEILVGGRVYEIP